MQRDHLADVPRSRIRSHFHFLGIMIMIFVIMIAIVINIMTMIIIIIMIVIIIKIGVQRDHLADVPRSRLCLNFLQVNNKLLQPIDQLSYVFL